MSPWWSIAAVMCACLLVAACGGLQRWWCPLCLFGRIAEPVIGFLRRM